MGKASKRKRMAAESRPLVLASTKTTSPLDKSRPNHFLDATKMVDLTIALLTGIIVVGVMHG